MTGANVRLFRSAALCAIFFLLRSSVSEEAAAAAAAAAAAGPRVRALVAPINKDDRTSLYTLPLDNREFVLDITGNLVWSECPLRHPLIPCASHYCTFANNFGNPLCRITPVAARKLHLNCSCSVAPLNPVIQTCAVADLTYNTTDLTILLSPTDGCNPTRTPTSVPGRFVFSCAPKSLFKSLPPGAAGVAGLGRSRVGLTSQLARGLSIQRRFAICLPGSGSSPGVAFFGEGPYVLEPGFDVTRVLSFTTLVKNPTNPGYYIDVDAVAVGGELVRFLARVLAFDADGCGGVKLCTATPYTTLKSHVYMAVLKAFAKATKGIPRSSYKVKPFDLCLNTTELGSATPEGLAVPRVDLMLGSGQNWTIFGANSMKQVTGDVACLAVVDGGEKAPQAAVIGAYQLQNNFLLFDVAKSTLGFSSSLSFFRTTCANFNFTTN